MADQDTSKAEVATRPAENGHINHEQDDRSRKLNLNELIPELQANILKHVRPLFTRALNTIPKVLTDVRYPDHQISNRSVAHRSDSMMSLSRISITPLASRLAKDLI
jgi:hypothetical protein